MVKTVIDEISHPLEFSWKDIEPYYQHLEQQSINQDNVLVWLSSWSQLIDLVSERYARLNVAVTLDTRDEIAENRLNDFLQSIFPKTKTANQVLTKKLLESGLEPAGFKNPLRKMRAEASIYREENLPLLIEERKIGSKYNKIIGNQTVNLKGKELTLQQLRPLMSSPDRSTREQIWHMSYDRQLSDRQKINDLWSKELQTRKQLQENTGLPDYREYRWRQMTRVDYTPEDCMTFHIAIEQVAVPAATRMYKKYQERLGISELRPWDLDLELYPLGIPPISSYGDIEDLASKAESVFHNVDPTFGDYFHIMRQEGLLNLENRKGKAPGAYCTSFPITQRPFIFMNAVGLPSDVRTILHESGHAFHNFERFKLPYAQQRPPGLEFAEVASMGMELLASPYLAKEQGGFYSQSESNRFRIQHLERILAFWPYMAVVDAFQHWVYTHIDMAQNASNCDAKWYELWLRYIPGVDWSGLEAEAMTGWHRKQHIHRAPFYYVEYGLAQLGAVQVWAGALQGQKAAVSRYRQALSLGGTADLPTLYRTAGAKFAFDAETLGRMVNLVETKINELELES